VSAKIIAIANMKGGVGKTATVVGLAETLAAFGIDRARNSNRIPKPVLVVDLDAQASASFAFAGDRTLTSLITNGETIDGFLERYFIRNEEPDFDRFIAKQVATVTHYDEPLAISLLASSPYLRTLERGLIHHLTQANYSLHKIENALFDLLASRFKAIAGRYDYILFDCPPGISMLTEVAIRLADVTVVPTVPDFLSVLGLEAFEQNVWSYLSSNVGGGLAKKSNSPYVLITKRKQINGHTAKVEELRRRVAAKRTAYRVLATEIAESTQVAQAVELIETFPTYAAKWGNIRQNLADLANEIESILGRRR